MKLLDSVHALLSRASPTGESVANAIADDVRLFCERASLSVTVSDVT
jgi:DNA-binding ferritin-like protein (Dps family)